MQIGQRILAVAVCGAAVAGCSASVTIGGPSANHSSQVAQIIEQKEAGALQSRATAQGMGKLTVKSANCTRRGSSQNYSCTAIVKSHVNELRLPIAATCTVTDTTVHCNLLVLTGGKVIGP
ncbi:MAG: hypothetical protein ABSG64_13630 [Solirubrobacteraceae bacterium]|jgi:hypothetical protein